jgi:hypothetical protein
MLQIFLIILAAHCIADFLLQTTWMVREKNRFAVLALHAGIHSIVTYLCLQQWDSWLLPVMVFVVHASIDYTKARLPGSAIYFALDQLLHVFSLLALAWIALRIEPYLLSHCWLVQPGWILLVGGLSITVWGVGYFLLCFSQPCGNSAGNSHSRQSAKTSLGRVLKNPLMVGQIERTLIFALVVSGYSLAVPLLAGLKLAWLALTVKERSFARFLIVLSLWSFGLALLLSLITVWAIGCDFI